MTPGPWFLDFDEDRWAFVANAETEHVVRVSSLLATRRAGITEVAGTDRILVQKRNWQEDARARAPKVCQNMCAKSSIGGDVEDRTFK